MTVAVALGLVFVDTGGLVVRRLGDDGRAADIAYLAFVLGRVVQNGSYIALIPQLLDFGSNGFGIFASTKVLVECLAKNCVSEGVAKDHPAQVDQTSSVVDEGLYLAGRVYQYRTEKIRRGLAAVRRLGRIKIERGGFLLAARGDGLCTARRSSLGGRKMMIDARTVRSRERTDELRAATYMEASHPTKRC